MWLFEETREYHARLDQHLLQPLVTGELDVDGYRTHLIRIYGFEAPLDAALAYTPGLPAIYEVRPRTGLLVRDLLSLGMRPAQVAALPQCSIALFATPSHALGWAYVIERSRLHHPVVGTHVLEQLPHVSCEYLCRDEIAVAARWNTLASTLDRHVSSPDDRTVIRDAAIEAFSCAIDWFGAGPHAVAR